MKNTKFFANIMASVEGLEEKRAIAIAKSAESAYRLIKVKEENALAALEIKLAGSEDMGKKQTTDLLDIDKFNGEDWAKKDHELNISIVAQELKTEAATNRYEFLFGEVKSK